MDAFRKMALSNVVADFDDMKNYMSKFDGKSFKEATHRIGRYPEYIEKKWLKIAIEKGIVCIETDADGREVFRFKKD
jgi:hypothetical protein